ncbi:MAG: hypothetical protein RG741_06825 [Bacteroidales bacterium]|nr:hypothetical protein [Bacteroidales bacterium]
MKSLLKLTGFVLIASVFWACEKNDPLADQAELTGTQTPFNLLAQMPDAAAGDTLSLRTVCWSVNDDIATVEFFHEGFKLRNYEVKMSVQTAAGNTYELATTLLEDSIFFDQSLMASYPEEGTSLLDHYQTYENAYVILHDFIVPNIYKLSRESNQDLILAMNENVYTLIVEKLSHQFNRAVMVTVFPEINQFSVVYFVIDDQGNFTGEITEEAVLYIQEHLTREKMNDFLREASVSDNTRVTVESVATLENNAASASSTRIFRVL